MPILAVDVGGTSIKARIFHTLNEYSSIHAIPTHEEGKHGLAVEKLFQFCHEVLDKQDVSRRNLTAIGFSVAGVVDQKLGEVRRALNIGWRNLALGEKASEVFSVPVVVDTDVFCGAIAEMKMGAGLECNSIMFVSIGTGIGHALVINRRLWRGIHESANVFGHVPVVADGAHCYCQSRGCLCQYASGEGIARLANEVIHSQTRTWTAKEVVQASLEGKLWARAILDKATGYLAIGLSSALALTDVGCVILSGGVVTEHWPDLQMLTELLSRFSHPEVKPFKLQRSTIQSNPNLFGAAALCFSHENSFSKEKKHGSTCGDNS